MTSVRSALGAGILGFVAYALASGSAAAPVPLQSPTATFSQTVAASNPPPYSPALAIDGVFEDIPGELNGWSIAVSNEPFGVTSSQTAVWETVSDAGPGLFAIRLHFFHSNPGHLLGRFRFSVTTDDRSMFADGQASGGDVSANWTVLNAPSIQGPPGMTFDILGDSSVLAGGTYPGTGIYEVSYLSQLSGVSGIRLEALEHATLPGGDGPGLYSNGNFVLTEIELSVTAIPEPSILLLFVVGAIALVFRLHRRAP